MEQQFKLIVSELQKVNQRLDTVDKRLDTVDKRLDTVDKRLDAVDKRLDTVDKRLDAVDKRLDSVDKRLDRLESEQQLIKQAVLETNERVKRLEGIQESQHRLIELLSARSIQHEAELKRIQ
ncbi:hypothetical protein AB1K83_10125 [Sporosarcina sp. 179-K 3D1 HS]|uniref:hypothetical protein n=1 Tax=Sporosarcina sp. 179-K 3D1 HS TaxID=3232169 RepID=UPI0039A254CF